MTSLERRRESRYRRRKAERAYRKAIRYANNDNFENVTSYKALYRANQKAIKSVIWKASVQRYQMSLLRNIEISRSKLLRQENISRGFVEFDLIERGRKRHIRSVHFSERVIQRSLCDNALVPMLSRSLIYDNGACLPGKGVDRTLDRLKAHLQQFYRSNHFSNNGYVAIFDFSGYFDSIRHDICFDSFAKEFTDERILWLLNSLIRPFGYPLQNSTSKYIRSPLTSSEYTGKSLGLGSEISQITAVSYPNPLDHYIKQSLRVRWYGRYMDDGYMIFKTKQEAHSAIESIISFAETLGIRINKKKTKVIKLSRGFVFLKTRHILTDSGRVVRKLSKDSVTRQRRKLKKFASMVGKGAMTLDDVATAYGSWKGYALRRGGRVAVRNMDLLFCQLFSMPAPKCRLQKYCLGGKEYGVYDR